MVGWIHTHPAFDVFLSSVDMHQQYRYVTLRLLNLMFVT